MMHLLLLFPGLWGLRNSATPAAAAAAATEAATETTGQPVIDDRLKDLLGQTGELSPQQAKGEGTAEVEEGSSRKIDDSWYIVQMGSGGQVVGRMHTTVTYANNLYESTESLEVVLQRGADRSAMFIETEVVEDAGGAVRMQRLAHQMGATMTTSVRYVWSEDMQTVKVTSSSGRGSHSLTRTEPAPNGTLVRGRHFTEQLFKRRAAAGEKQVQPPVARHSMTTAHRVHTAPACQLPGPGLAASSASRVWHVTGRAGDSAARVRAGARAYDPHMEQQHHGEWDARPRSCLTRERRRPLRTALTHTTLCAGLMVVDACMHGYACMDMHAGEPQRGLRGAGRQRGNCGVDLEHDHQGRADEHDRAVCLRFSTPPPFPNTHRM
eukprot:SAG25_NODE_432_length_8108_cov_357.746442_9_plen_380_part_00